MFNVILSRKSTFLFFCCFAIHALSAQTCTIFGKVIDAKTQEPIPFANVFLNNTTLGVASDVEGVFVLKNIRQPSTHELIVSFVGYQTHKTRISLTNTELNLGIIRLQPSEVQLNTVEIKGTKDVQWEKKIKKFKKIFLGDDPIASQCNITNAWVINFQDESDGNNLIATASQPIEIENNALGFKVTFYLTRFVANPTAYIIQGDARFEPLQSNDFKVVRQWDLNREKSYFGSSQHLFKAMLEHRIHGEGFNLYATVAGFEKTRSSLFSYDLGKGLIELDTVKIYEPITQKDVYRIEWKGTIEAHYRKSKVKTVVYQDIHYPVSWISAKKGYVLINRDGIPMNPSDIVLSGAMTDNRVANMLPLDYLPISQVPEDITMEQRDVFKVLYEKLYVQTDKPYYYPGETIWLKGYINYSSPYMRDSLSRTVYTELINPLERKVIASRILKIDSGTFHADFVLPDTLQAASYVLRSYTNWSRNYGEVQLNSIHIPVLRINEKPVLHFSQKKDVSDRIIFETEKDTYLPREKITVKLKIKDSDDNPVYCKLSISVTDADQVLPIEVSSNILSGFPIHEVPSPIAKPVYSVDFGIPITAQVVQEKYVAGKGLLNIFQLSGGKFFIAEMNENGIFNLNGLQFYGTSQFSVRFQNQSNKKSKDIRQLKLIPYQIPELIFNDSFEKIEVLREQLPQRESSSFELTAKTKLLDQLVVQSPKEETPKRPYGKPDYILKASDLQQSIGNLLLTLPGKVPGLIVRQDVNNNWLVYIQRAHTSSFSNAKEVVVLVNDVFTAGSPADIISAIDPMTVETIEVKSGINVLYGGMAGSGILSIYTKKGVDVEIDRQNQAILSVDGYYIPRIFPAVDYSTLPKSKTENDFRSLIYWNPLINTDRSLGQASISFYASDRITKYRMVVEGVTDKGEPIHAEHIISVQK